MYVPPHNEEPSREVLFDLIQNNVLGVLITHGSGGLDANHIPFDFGVSWIGLTTEEVTAPAVTLVQRLPVPITWAGVLAWVDS